MRAVVCFALSALLLAGVHTAPLISAPWGQMAGVDGSGPSGAPYSAYLGIPYALPPVGERRWAKPVPHPGYAAGQVFNATSEKYVCPQKSLGGVKVEDMDEDCLWLSVYVPTAASTSARPKSVMLWIHGGGFTLGSASPYKPSALITTHDVIVVVIQYRLDVLGFLSSADDVIPGNYGLWDQALALKWVKDNIRAFGGDPDSITLFGQSAGAASVGYHVLSPASKGVNFRAILQSGTPLAHWAFQEDPLKVLKVLANNTGCLTPTGLSDRMYYAVAGQRADHQRMLTCLRGKGVATLIHAVEFIPVQGSPFDVLAQKLWAPTIDGDFLPRHPQDLLGDAAYLADVGAASRDVMVGMVNEEGGMFQSIAQFLDQLAPKDVVQGMEDIRFDEKMARFMLTTELLFRYGQGLQKDPQRLKTLTDVLSFFYTPPVQGQVVEQEVIDTFTDTFFTAPTVRFLRDLTRASDQLRLRGSTAGGRGYLYLFNHYPASRRGLAYGRGCYHGYDLAYEFDPNPYFGVNYTFTAEDRSLAAIFRALLTDFAKTGTPQLTTGQSAAPWPEFRLSDQQYLSLAPLPRVDRDLYGKRVAVWLDLLPSLVNSTAGINLGSWALPWSQQTTQQQQHCPQGRGSCASLPVPFVFKGSISFFRLP